MKRVVPVLVGLVMLAGCTTLHQGMREAVPQAETWAVIPFVNNTETPLPQSGLRRSVPRCYTPVESNGW